MPMGVTVFQSLGEAVEGKLQKVSDDNPEAPGAARHGTDMARLRKGGHPQKHGNGKQKGAREGVGCGKPIAG